MAEIALKDMIQQLRRELREAVLEGEGDALKFRLDGVELELQVGVTRSEEARGGIKFWVLNAGAKTAEQGSTTQTLRLKLVPRDGRAGTRGFEIGD